MPAALYAAHRSKLLPFFPVTTIPNFSTHYSYGGEVRSPCTLGTSKSAGVTPFLLSLAVHLLPVHRYPVCLVALPLRARPGNRIGRRIRCAFALHGSGVIPVNDLRSFSVLYSAAQSAFESSPSPPLYWLLFSLPCYHISLSLSFYFCGVAALAAVSLFTALEHLIPVLRLYYKWPLRELSARCKVRHGRCVALGCINVERACSVPFLGREKEYLGH